jgi:hypothetical protein
MDLTVYLKKNVRKFSRYHKYTLGAGSATEGRILSGRGELLRAVHIGT